MPYACDTVTIDESAFITRDASDTWSSRDVVDVTRRFDFQSFHETINRWFRWLDEAKRNSWLKSRKKLHNEFNWAEKKSWLRRKSKKTSMPINSASHSTVRDDREDTYRGVNNNRELVGWLRRKTLSEPRDLSTVKWIKQKNAINARRGTNTSRSSRFEAQMYSGRLSKNVNKNMRSLAMGLVR